MEKRKILIVDDEEKFGRMVKMVLDATGSYEAGIECRGRHAVAACRAFKPDLVFLDIAMPDMDGSEVAGILKEDPELKNIPVVFLTAMVAKGEMGPNAKIGGYPFLAKPVSADDIIACLARIFKK